MAKISPETIEWYREVAKICREEEARRRGKRTGGKITEIVYRRLRWNKKDADLETGPDPEEDTGSKKRPKKDEGSTLVKDAQRFDKAFTTYLESVPEARRAQEEEDIFSGKRPLQYYEDAKPAPLAKPLPLRDVPPDSQAFRLIKAHRRQSELVLRLEESRGRSRNANWESLVSAHQALVDAYRKQLRPGELAIVEKENSKGENLFFWPKPPKVREVRAAAKSLTAKPARKKRPAAAPVAAPPAAAPAAVTPVAPAPAAKPARPQMPAAVTARARAKRYVHRVPVVAYTPEEVMAAANRIRYGHRRR
jgi:hypothetical protein